MAALSVMALALAGGLGLMVIGYFLAPVYLRMIRTPEHLLQDAAGYLRIYFLSFLSVTFYNFGAGILRALGNSKSPLQAQLFGGLMNVAMDWLFIRVLQDGVRGVAWATLISQTAAAAVIFYKITHLEEDYSFHPRKLGFDGAILRQVIGIGLPAGIQALVITLSNVFVQSHINGFGEDAIAAFTAYFKVESLIYAPILALGSAILTFAGRHHPLPGDLHGPGGDHGPAVHPPGRRAVPVLQQGTGGHRPGPADHQHHFPLLFHLLHPADLRREHARRGKVPHADDHHPHEHLPDPHGTAGDRRAQEPFRAHRGGGLSHHMGADGGLHDGLLLRLAQTA